MLSIAWLVGLNVTFLFLRTDPAPAWRERFLAEANIRRAIAYRYVDIKGGIVADRGHSKGLQSDDTSLDPESLGAPPMGIEGDPTTGLSTEPLAGSRIAHKDSLLAMEIRDGEQQGRNHDGEKAVIVADIDTLRGQISEANRARRAELDKLSEVRDVAKLFAAEMQAYRYIIASFQQKVFNLDYEIQRVIIERDALTAELAQVGNDIQRIRGQKVALDDVYYQVSRSFDRNIKVLALYETLDPNLRRMADRVGRGWLKGRVISASDDPRDGVVAISIGSQDGVKHNQEFSVFRNRKFIARMRIYELEDNYAVGKVLPDFRGRVIEVNDLVKVSETYGGATLKRGG